MIMYRVLLASLQPGPSIMLPDYSLSIHYSVQPFKNITFTFTASSESFTTNQVQVGRLWIFFMGNPHDLWPHLSRWRNWKMAAPTSKHDGESSKQSRPQRYGEHQTASKKLCRACTDFKSYAKSQGIALPAGLAALAVSIKLIIIMLGGGGHSNTSAVHMRDQRFSKHTLNAIFPLQEKHP